MSNNNPLPNVPPGGGSPNNAGLTGSARDTARLLVAGFVGGLMTPMIHPLEEFLKLHRYPSDFDVWYWIIGAGLGILGTVMVWLLNETDVKKALILGISLPAFFTSLGGAVQNTSDSSGESSPPGATQLKAESKGAVGMIPFFVTSAYAQEPTVSPQPLAGPLRSVEIDIDGQPFAYHGEILDGQGNVLDQFDASGESLLVARALPENAATARLTAGGPPLTQELSVKPGYTMEIELHAATFVRKFAVAQVFGKAAELVAEKLSAKVSVRPKATVGLQGWIYVGTLRNGRWAVPHTVAGMDMPKVGDIREIIFAANVRDEPGSKNPPLGVISVFQRVQFIAFQDRSGSTWARVDVQP